MRRNMHACSWIRSKYNPIPSTVKCSVSPFSEKKQKKTTLDLYTSLRENPASVGSPTTCHPVNLCKRAFHWSEMHQVPDGRIIEDKWKVVSR